MRPRSIRRRLAKRRTGLRPVVVLAVLLLATSTNLTSMVLQSAGWALMLTDFLREDAPVEAIERTLSGDHPCSLCHLSQALQQDAEDVPATSLKSGSHAPVTHLRLAECFCTPGHQAKGVRLAWLQALFAGDSPATPNPLPG